MVVRGRNVEDHSLPPSGPEQDTHTRLLSSRERTLPSPRNEEGRRKLSLQLEFLLMLLPREKKKKIWSNFGFPLLHIGTVD